jgi:tRNA (cmo5U34)-methyltransferase
MEETVIDRTSPKGRWEFDEDVTSAFPDMLGRSIPLYSDMRKACFDLGCRFVRQRTAIVDLGCSRGDAMAPFVDRFGACNTHVGIEVSPPMLAAARARFKGLIDCGVVHVTDLDLRKAYPPFQASLTLCVLTLQFTPIEHRQRIVRDAWKATLPGGAFILVEKVLGSCAETDKLMNESYWDMKLANGYGRDDVERKRLSLEGVLVPVSAAWNEDLLRSAGFRQVECFFRMLNFGGWIAVRDE